MRILLVDDHALFREGLAHVLEGLADDVRIVHAATAAEALAVTGHYSDLDLILLDLNLPGVQGIEIMARLRSVVMTVPVIMLSASDRAEDVRRSLDAGAVGYIPKTASSFEMLDAVKRCLNGDIYVPASLLAAMNAGTADKTAESLLVGSGASSNEPAPVGATALTTRQLEVLRLLGQGLSNKGIANRLDLTEGTVKLHVSAIMRALAARNRTDAVVSAKRIGLLDP